MERQTNEIGAWSRARFPSNGMRERFMGHVRLWNGLEDLPQIEVEALGDGVGVKFRARDGRLRGLHLLIDSLGGRITFQLDGGLRGGPESSPLAAGAPSTP